MVTWQTDRGTLGPSFLYHELGKICLRLIVRQIVRLRLRVRLRRVHKAKFHCNVEASECAVVCELV